MHELYFGNNEITKPKESESNDPNTAFESVTFSAVSEP